MNKIPRRSLKRTKEEALYEKTKAKKREDMIEGKYFRCFFSNKVLNEDPNIKEPWHHALGREGDLLYDYRNIFPCIHEYHQDYHNLSIDKLLKEQWYKDFLKRVEKMNKAVYNQELRRMNKAGIIDNEQFFNMLKP